MFRALFWKEWRQLSLVRWGGVAIGALLPVAFLAGAEMAKRGMLPTNIERYSARDIMFEILPFALALGLWPLMGLMTAVQSLSADRNAGTESFLLERPVPRTSIWFARLAASLTALVVVIVVTGATGAMIAKSFGVPATGWTTWLQSLLGGSLVALLAFIGGVIASSLLAAPLGAVLAGTILAAIPVVIGAELGGNFPHAHIASIPIGIVLPALMLPGYIVASWSASCRGEPAGRGRLTRGLSICGGAVLLVFALFVTAAPVVVRAHVGQGLHQILPDTKGRTAFVGGGRDGKSGEGGWLVDVPSGRKLAFMPPPIQAVEWNLDGSKVAVLSWSAPLGGQAHQARIDVFRTDTGDIERSIDLPHDDIAVTIAWADDAILALVPHRSGAAERSFSVRAAGARTGVWRTIGDTGDSGASWATLTGSREDGRVFLRLPGTRDDASVAGYVLRPIDVKKGEIGEPLADGTGRTVRFSDWAAGLSPGGRFATTVKVAATTPREVQFTDLKTGATQSDVPVSGRAVWAAEDQLAWLAADGKIVKLMLAAPGGSTIVAKTWNDAEVSFAPSSDGRALYTSAKVDGSVEEGVYTLSDRRWIPMPQAPASCVTEWAGPKTLARIAPDVVYFEDIDKPGVKRFVLGSEADLR